MPKRKRKIRTAPNFAANFTIKIKDEIGCGGGAGGDGDDEEAFIKSEPIDNGYDINTTQFQAAKTVILNGNDKNQEDIENEIGLVSQLDIVKTEIDVDEVAVNEFREELQRMSIDAAPKELNKKHRRSTELQHDQALSALCKKSNEKKIEKEKRIATTIPKKIVLKKKKKLINFKKCNKKQNTQKSVEPLDILLNGKKMVKCPFCDKIATTRDRSVVKIHIRYHTGETPFKCKYCNEKFVERGSLRSHIESHHKMKRIKCELCKRVFYDMDEFRSHELKCVKRRSFECYLCGLQVNRLHMNEVKEHMRIHHTGEKSIECKHCSEKFVSKCRLSNHIQRSHSDMLPFMCSICEYKFEEVEKYRKHEQHCRVRRRLECYLCQYSHRSLTFDVLELHMRKHTGEKPHQCHLCNKYFPRSEALAQHLQRHRDTFKLKCASCHKRFMNSNELVKHESICRRRRYECHLCGYTMFGISFNKFSRHMARHTGVNIIRCHGCSKSFSNYRYFGNHIFESHPHLIGTICPNCCHKFNTKMERDVHQLNCTKRRIECYICRKSSWNFKAQLTHMRSRHMATQRFQCNICSRTYELKHNLDIHMKSHTKIGLVKCKYCSKTFSDIKYKKKHEFLCKNVYECYLCKKLFRSFNELYRVHMKSHLGTKPYDCRHCSRSTGSIRCYNLHVIDHHLHLYKFQCNPCKGLILKRKDFRTHQKSCMKGIRQSQGVIYFKCSLCGNGLARLPNLRNHILNGECKKHPKKVKL